MLSASASVLGLRRFARDGQSGTQQCHALFFGQMGDGLDCRSDSAISKNGREWGSSTDQQARLPSAKINTTSRGASATDPAMIWSKIGVATDSAPLSTPTDQVMVAA